MIQPILLSLTLPIYAIIVMTLLLDIKKEGVEKHITPLFLFSLFVLLSNYVIFQYFGLKTYQRLYPVLVQVPVYFIFLKLSKYNGIKVLFTLLTAISLASLPIESVVFFRILSNGNSFIMIIGAIVSYLIIFFLVYRFLRPNYIYMLEHGDTKHFLKFCIIPILFYIYSYQISHYNFTSQTNFHTFFPACIPILIVYMSYILLIDMFKSIHETTELKTHEKLFLTQIAASEEQIKMLRNSEKKSAICRHDLRHHMNYLNTCIMENKLEEATSYIKQTFEELDNIKIIQYSTNESINLILAFYVAKANTNHIPIYIQNSATDFTRFQIVDLCSLLSNALENAIHACEQAKFFNDRSIKMHMYEKNHKLCIVLHNTTATLPPFENGIPISSQKEHGVGTLSMIHVIEKYGGVYKFSVEEHTFTFQISM